LSATTHRNKPDLYRLEASVTLLVLPILEYLRREQNVADLPEGRLQPGQIAAL